MGRSVLVALLALAGAAVSCAGPRGSWHASPLVGRTVALAAPRLDGGEARLPSTDARVTVVDFWATWCDPCRDQMPLLDGLARRYRERGVSVYAVSFDEDRAALEEFLARTPVEIPVLWDKGGAALAERMEVTRLPTTVLLDGAGVVRAVHLGYEKDQAAALEREVLRVLGE